MIRISLSTGHALEFLGIAGALDCDPGGGAVDLAKIVSAKFDCGCSDVLFQPVQFRRAWNRNDPGLLRQQSCQRYLRRCRALPFRDLAEQLEQRLICFPRFLREARKRVAKVGTIERSVLVDLSS